MNIGSYIADTNTYDTKKKCTTMASHRTTQDHSPSLVTELPALPCFMHSVCANRYPWQSSAFPPFHPVPLTSQHQMFSCTSPLPLNNHPKKSFLIKDILGATDSTSDTTGKISGRPQRIGIFRLSFYFV